MELIFIGITVIAIIGFTWTIGLMLGRRLPLLLALPLSAVSVYYSCYLFDLASSPSPDINWLADILIRLEKTFYYMAPAFFCFILAISILFGIFKRTT